MQALLPFAESNQQLWRLQSQSLAATIGINQVWNSKTATRKHRNLNTTTGKALTTREREREKGSSAAPCQLTIFVVAFTHLAAEETLAMGCAISTQSLV
jgi:hypothetical protein